MGFGWQGRAFGRIVLAALVLALAAGGAAFAPAETRRPPERIAVLGDSISTFAGVSEDSAGGRAYIVETYPADDVTDVSQMWWDILRRGMNPDCDVSVSAISGSGYWLDMTPLAPPGYTDERIARLGADGAPDYIFINLGTNDKRADRDSFGENPRTRNVDVLEAAKSTVAGACALTIVKLQQAYPDSRIVVLLPKWSLFSDTARGRRAREHYLLVCDCVAEVAQSLGVYRVIDLRNCGVSPATVESCTFDGLHPNARGMALMAEYTLSQLGY